MNKSIRRISAVTLVCTFIFISACDSGQAPAQPPVQTIPQVPMQVAPTAVPTPQPQVAIPAPPPATPLIPVGDTPTEPSTSRKGTGSGNIDKPLAGKGTSGDELIGNYSCAVDSKKLSIGPFKAPPFGCKIYRSQDGALKVGSSSGGAGSMKGDVKDQTQTGFFVIGKYEVSGNSLAIKAKMKMSGPGKYSGSGRGRFNDDKADQIDYKLTMTKK